MSKGYCNHSCRHFKYENVYETFLTYDPDMLTIIY